MGLKKRLKAVGIIVAVAALTFGIACSGMQVSKGQEETIFTREKETLYLWYTDEALTSYLSAAAVAYNETHDVRVVPVLESGLEYLENINRSSLEGDGVDMYVLSHDSLGKAYLAGLASKVQTGEDFSMEDAYIRTGLQAASYGDDLLGYPFYFETSALLYNKTYLEDMARSQLEAEAAVAAEEAAESSGDNGEPAIVPDTITQEQARERMQALIPATIEDIKTVADNYDAPEQVEGVFKWDVTDIFYNYFFVGDSVKMGGEAGWDTSQIDIYNREAIDCMRAYQELNQFFSIDTNEIDYEMVLDEFMAGEMVFTMATTDAVFKLEHAKADGLLSYEYGVALAPDVDESHKTRSLSVTNCVVVNGYCENKEAANDFARFVTAEYNDILYARTGKVSAAKGVDNAYEALDGFVEEYERSISMPKMIETSNFWVKLEVAFSQVWNGADANAKLKELSEQMITQVTGSAYEEEYLEEAPKEEEEEEYLDEELYRQEAMEEE